MKETGLVGLELFPSWMRLPLQSQGRYTRTHAAML